LYIRLHVTKNGLRRFLVRRSVVLGLFSGTISMFYPKMSFVLDVAFFWERYLSYMMFFFGGGIAQRND
jgi:hypothetical protein